MQFIPTCSSAVYLKYGLFYYSSVPSEDHGKFSFSLLPTLYDANTFWYMFEEIINVLVKTHQITKAH